MARKKLSEYRAKTILSEALGLPYAGLSVDVRENMAKQLSSLPASGHYVVKVDQGVKGRFKKGLVKLDVPSSGVAAATRGLLGKGYWYAVVEPYAKHEAGDERYLSVTLERDGDVVTVSAKGGIDVEEHAEAMDRRLYKPGVAEHVDRVLGLKPGFTEQLVKACRDNYFSFVEINPLVVHNGTPLLLDAAVEVDEEAAPFVHGRWSDVDFREGRTLTEYEQAVAELAAQSQASFRLLVLNPDGAVFVLLSGGGASVVVADEVHNQGFGKALVNYGEYSGNPSEDETYLYTKQVVAMMLASKAPRKVLVIGGGVANFTDVRVTFRGVIRALDEAKEKLKKQGVRVFVRRGGPYEREGLALMRTFLAREGMLGQVAGPELMLAEIVREAVGDLEAKK